MIDQSEFKAIWVWNNTRRSIMELPYIYIKFNSIYLQSIEIIDI